MKKTIAAVVLLAFAATPCLAGLKFVATPDVNVYDVRSGPLVGTGNVMTLSVDLDAMPTGAIQFVTGPALSATPITVSFVANGPTSGALPTITGTRTNNAGGWNSVVAPTTNTFTAFNFQPQNLPPAATVGFVDFDLADVNTNGLFDLMVSAFALDGVDMPAQVIGTIQVVGVPEPSSFLLLGLVGSSIAGVQVWRRRKQSEAGEPVETEEVA